MLRRFLRVQAAHLGELSQLPEPSRYFDGRSFDLEAWVTDPTVPHTNFIASAPVSVPVIGVLSLARYSVICQILGITPGGLRRLLRSTTGHSQGLLVSICISLSDTWDSFYENAKLIVESLFWLGWESHNGAPWSVIPPASSAENQDTSPSYMLSVRNVKQERMQYMIASINKTLPKRLQLHLALINARDQFVVAGPVSSLVHLDSHLRENSLPEKDQTRIPFSSRKASTQYGFLPISTPFHTPYLRDEAERLKTRFANRSILARQLGIPVYHTRTGQDLRDRNDNLLHIAFDAITQELCDWPAALADGEAHGHGAPRLSHIVAFDRGGLGPLVKKVKEGHGLRVMQGADLDSRDSEIGTMRDLFSPRLLDSSTKLQSWSQRFQLRHTTDTAVGLETRLSRLLGTPPVMVAGMTPTTTHWDFVSAIMNAGYHVELAAGGYHKASDMETAIRKLAASISPGRGITCNVIYANPRSVAWQIALIRRLSNSVPIDGLTIGAGVPSPEVVAEYIQTLGLRHISFKPGSITAIRQVVDIAKGHPDFPIILQWTGGRGGGHHSFEDFHAPILNTYALIRQQPNLYLVAGSGFGNGESMYPYLTGSWSTSMGHAAMPFDGILLGSRMMVAREAHTSPAVKRIISETPGVPDSMWENTYYGPAGGVMTVQSEMGEPIHKIATRGVRFWAEMDRKVFSLPRKDRVPYLNQHRESIIHRLNADSAKPWFGRNVHGDVIDLKDMTYVEVLGRMIDLMYVRRQTRWIDTSYIDFTMAFAKRALGRLSCVTQRAGLTHAVLKDDPDNFIYGFINSCPKGVDTVLNPEDVSFFLLNSKKAGQKPVNFIPALDDDFEQYFKKDSLWQSEDIDAVIDQDADRSCILHGPVAAQFSLDQDESAKDILDSITQSLVDSIQRDLHDDPYTPDSGLITPDSWSTISPIGRELPMEISIPSSTTLSESADDRSLSPMALSMGSSGSVPTWVRAVLGEKLVQHDRSRRTNPFHDFVEAHPECVARFDADRSELSIVAEDASTVISSVKITSYNGVDIVAAVYPTEKAQPLQLLYHFNPHRVPSKLIEDINDRNELIRSFYSNLWFENTANLDMTIHDTFYGREMTLSREVVDSLIMAVGFAFGDHRLIYADSSIIPISIGIVIAWDVISRPLVAKGIGGDLLRLVHRSNTFQYYPHATPLMLGDTVSSRSQVQAVYIEDSGKVVVVKGDIIRCGKPVMTVTSTFLFRGSFKSQSTFRHTKEPEWTVLLESKLDEAVLRHREWLCLHGDTPPLVGKTVVFDLDSYVTHKDDRTKMNKLRVTGAVRCQLRGYQWQQIGTVNFESDDCVGNPVLDFLERNGTVAPSSMRVDLKEAGWSGPSSLEVQMPGSNQPYAQVSRDFNPIHVSSIFAKLAEVSGTLTHGMCTSAIAAFALEHLVLEGDRSRLRRFSASFTAMVMPLERLVLQIKHTSMVDGRMLFTMEAFRKSNDETVLKAEAEVEQPATAYLFTGQGSQSKGMGMDLYEASSVARKLWDEIDAQLYDSYGWSLLDIVRNNPKTLTVNFGGKRGRRVKRNYLSITTEVALPDGSRIEKPVLAGLTAASTSYTFTDSRGLLFSTQFAQPAILLFEAAVFAEMRAKGYVPHDAMYAGHSLGEYGALSALSRYVPTGALAELAFYRGLMMQASVARDGGSTTYGMVAANPRRVGQFFNQTALDCLVRMIATASHELLEIVNFNVDGEQYVCSGTTTNLHVLGKLLDHVAQSPSGPKQVQDAVESDAMELKRVIQSLIEHAKTLPQPIELRRGKATIPLQGIDVPFHSSHLRSTVDRFRQCLLKPGFLEGNVDVDELMGRYIPNLMAKPFCLDEAYIREAFELTQSEILGEMLGV